MLALPHQCESVSPADVLAMVVEVAHPDDVVKLLVQGEAAAAELGAQSVHQLAVLGPPQVSPLRCHVRVDEGDGHVVQAQRHTHTALRRERGMACTWER